MPDSFLAQLPFETLVIRAGAQPQYLLDAGLPTEYAPSATMLLNLAERQVETPAPAAEPVLTVGNPKYDQPRSGDAEKS